MQSTGVFLRLPDDQARLLDRAASAVSASKKDLVGGLVARYVDPDTPRGLASLRDISSPGGSGRRIVVEAEDSSLQTGQHSFYPDPAPPDVLDAAQAAELFGVDTQMVLDLAERGEIPGRKLGSEWRFARQALLNWLARVDV